MTRFGGCSPMSWRRRASSARSSRHSSVPSASGTRIAVERREHLIGQDLQDLSALAADALAQHALHRFGDDRQAERIGAPARHLDGCLEFRFPEQHLGVVAGARAGILVNSLLHQEGGVLVHERRRPRRHRESAACGGKNRAVPSFLRRPILARSRPGETSRDQRKRTFLKCFKPQARDIGRKSYKAATPADASLSSTAPRTRP